MEEEVILEEEVTSETRFQGPLKGSASPRSGSGKSSKSRSGILAKSTSRLTKSGSDLQEKPTPSRKRLLARGGAGFRYSLESDLPYFWAAYRTGSFSVVNPVFSETLSKERFAEELGLFLERNALTAVSFLDNEGKVIGCGLFWVRGRVLQTENLIWFKWASGRKILECYVNFIDTIRRTSDPDTGRSFMVLEFAMEKDKRFFDHVCSYGVMRRVGSSLEVYGDFKACIYESRSVKNAE